MTPTRRTLQLLRRAGFLAAVVECWLPIPGRKLRRDLFGFADVLAVHPLQRVFLLVQTTSASNLSARLAKAKGRPELRTWLAAGGTFEVHGWSARGVKRVTLAGPDLDPLTIAAPPRRRWQLAQRGVLRIDRKRGSQ